MTPPGVDDAKAPRLVGGATVALGVVLMARPGLVAHVVSGAGRQVPRAVVELLGTRYVTQGAAQLARPTAVIMKGSALVDVVHAVSMVALAAVRIEYRRPALISATVATGSAAVCALTARHSNASAR